MTVSDSSESGYYTTARKEIERLLPDHLGAVLELGCGAGATMEWLRTARSVDSAFGIELVEAAAETARSVFNKVLVCDVERSTLPTNQTFDTIIALDVLEHLADPWTITKRLADLLNPGGIFVASIPNVSHWHAAAHLFLRGRWDYRPQGILDRTHLRFFTEETALDLLSGAGLAIEKIDYVKIYPGSTPAMRWRNKRIMEKFLPQSLSRFVKFQFLIRARKKHVDARAQP